MKTEKTNTQSNDVYDFIKQLLKKSKDSKLSSDDVLEMLEEKFNEN